MATKSTIVVGFTKCNRQHILKIFLVCFVLATGSSVNSLQHSNLANLATEPVGHFDATRSHPSLIERLVNNSSFETNTFSLKKGATKRKMQPPNKTLHQLHNVNRHPFVLDWTMSCGNCNAHKCEKTPTDCPTGLTRDICDCCYVCGNQEGYPCDLPNRNFRFGHCRKGLTCIPVQHKVSVNDAAEGYCTCASSMIICGNDGKSYSNPCRFKRASSRKAGLSILHEGPCLTKPIMEIPLMNQTAEVGSSAVFSCTVSGAPLAWFEWLKGEQNVFLSERGGDITLQVSYGPLKYQVTAWLQIEKVFKAHAGIYACVARNRFGDTSATAHLDVIEGDSDDPKRYVYRGRRYRFDRQHGSLLEAKATLQTYNPDYLRSHLTPSDYDEINQDSTQHVIDDKKLKNYDDFITHDDMFNEERSDVAIMYDDDISEEEEKAMFEETLEQLIKPKDFKQILLKKEDFLENSLEGSGN